MHAFVSSLIKILYVVKVERYKLRLEFLSFTIYLLSDANWKRLKLNFWATLHMKGLFQIFLLVSYVFVFGSWAEYHLTLKVKQHYYPHIPFIKFKDENPWNSHWCLIHKRGFRVVFFCHSYLAPFSFEFSPETLILDRDSRAQNIVKDINSCCRSN